MNKIISWLLEGDVAIQYQAYRDLQGIERPSLRKRISTEGWGKQLLSLRHADGHWGSGFYQPKWTSTHYTLLDLRNLDIWPDIKPVTESLNLIFENLKAPDGGIYGVGVGKHSDVCINGMVLNYASYFHVKEDYLKSLVDFLLGEQMADGGFNCQSNRNGAVHSSLHSTLSVVEGIHEYEKNGYRYRLDELRMAKKESGEFILIHQLFRSHRTGKIINPDFLKLHYPCRWHYDILRALDYFQAAKIKYDSRMKDAIELIKHKQYPEGYWKLASPYPGQTHIKMEAAGKPSRWNTLRALRSLKIQSFL